MKTLPRSVFLKRISIIAISFFLTGLFSNYVLVSDLNIATVNPAAGLAFISILLWNRSGTIGVFIGAYLLSITIASAEYTSTITNNSALVSASGATLQAMVSAWLTAHFLKRKFALTKEKDILIFLLIAGPLCSIISASTTIIYQLYIDLSVNEEVAMRWLFLWSSDALGVVITSPFLMQFFGSPKRLWKSRSYSLTSTFLTSILAVVLLFNWISRWEQEKLEFEFNEATNELHEKLSSNFKYYLDTVSSVERLFYSTQNVSRQQFRDFVAIALQEKSGIHGLSWNPIVKFSEKEIFEQQVREEGFSEFKITERDEQGALNPVKRRDRYIVVNFIEPMATNLKAFGFDVGSNIERLEAMNLARDLDQPIATAKITLVQETGKQAGFLLFTPVYSAPSSTVAQRRINIIGYAVGVFRIGEIINNALRGKNREKVYTSVFDSNSKGESIVLYAPETTQLSGLRKFESTEKLVIGGREWLIKYSSSSNMLNDKLSSQTIILCLTTLIICIFLCTYVLTVTGRSFQLNSQVRIRTREIKEHQKKLQKTNLKLEKTISDLERSNQDLDQYAFVASHDLKSPLHAIYQLSTWIEEDCAEVLPENSQRHLILLKSRIKRMEKLLEDLLLYSRIDRTDYPSESFNLEEIARQAFNFNSGSEKFTLQLENCGHKLVLPRVLFELMLRNLLSNAVNHHDKPNGTIIVRYSKDKVSQKLSVVDDGPGIPLHLQQRVYDLFDTLKPRDEIEGSGLGLSIVKKAAAQFGGEVILTSDGKHGTCFDIVWKN